MKYTISIDDIERCSLRPTIRLTREEYRLYNFMAQQLAYKNLTDWLNNHIEANWKEVITDMLYTLNQIPMPSCDDTGIYHDSSGEDVMDFKSVKAWLAQEYD